MSNNYKNQTGFAAILAVLVVFIAAVVGCGAYYVSSHKDIKTGSSSSNTDSKSSNSNSKTSTATPSAAVTKDWKTYVQPADKGVTFKYPADWRLGEADGADIGDGVKNVSLTSPNGTELDLRSTGAGLGGNCMETEHSKTITSKPIAGAPGLYVVSWELLDGSTLLTTGLDVMNGSSQSSKVYTEVGNHTACITFSFAFSSPSPKGYFFGLVHSSKLAAGDETIATQILGTLTVK